MSTPRQRSSSASSHPAKRNGKAVASPSTTPQTSAPLPAPDDREGWRVHWAAQGQPWRTEPEIDSKRQEYLAKQRTIFSSIKDPLTEQDNYPFKHISLSRADIEWLLVGYESASEPVDLRQADLQAVDLRGLPFTQARTYFTLDEIGTAVYLHHSFLLEGANLVEAHLEGMDLTGAHLPKTEMSNAHLAGADLSGANLEWANLTKADLKGANLTKAHLGGANLTEADLTNVHLDGIFLATQKPNIIHPPSGNELVGIGPLLVDIRWGDTQLSSADWRQMILLGDEWDAQQKKTHIVSWYWEVDEREEQAKDYQRAMRANRQLAVALRNQGLNEDADHFTYRAQKLQRTVLRYQMRQRYVSLGHRVQILREWFFSWFLFLLAGYGYKPGRSFLAYLLVISGFATAYYFLGHTIGPTLSPLGAFVFSMTSFHGRGFFPGSNISLDDPLTVLAALEALVGLFIEVTFIATLTKRFFG